MLFLVVGVGLSVAVAGAAGAREEAPPLEFGSSFPLPPALEESVRFWVDVFSRYGLDEAIVHDREDPAQSIALLNRIAARPAGAFSLIMFPEGTRSRDGRMGPFKNGAFTLAVQLGRPIVPIAIHGTSSIMPAGKYLSILPGTVVLEVLQPIETKGRDVEERVALRDLVAQRIAERLAAARDAES